MLLLCISLFVYQSENTCDKCEIRFSSKMNISVFNLSISSIYESYLEDKCAVIKSGGAYVRNG